MHLNKCVLIRRQKQAQMRSLSKLVNATGLTRSLNKSLHELRMLSGIKVKLVAIARNESAYLAEWIYHHLYFGFDHIEIHTNHCSDNTDQLLAAIGHPSVTVINADDCFSGAADSPQVRIYREAFYTAWRQGYTHLMFLDIDEFWVPANLKDSINSWIKRHKHTDIMCFSWLNKTDEHIPFGHVIDNCRFEFEAAEQVKSVYKTTVTPVTMNPHNVIDHTLTYCRDNGDKYAPINEHFSRTLPLVPPFTQERAFIIHRKYRSEKEYISMLGKGRPIGTAATQSIFKDNRHGYIKSNKKHCWVFGSTAFTRYQRFMFAQLQNDEIQTPTGQGQAFVDKRYKEVLDLIETAPKEERQTLNRLLRHVNDANALAAFQEFKQSHGLS
ncbi:glycosyltransferase family 2 protein [Salinimonas lutimaris]|uniref:glycosyltransferase family 2 protein n=1 Tax=Salinimonas lutimaris TaxID=914153 RepID=UPI0010C0021F|nr:glycosyltransferase family 2 protein [Salinimonas lutimaris]